MSPEKSQNHKTRQYTKGQPFMPVWLDDSDLNDSQMRILLHLWRRGQNCYPSIKSIARQLKKSEATVARCIKTLESMRFLIRKKRKGNNVHNSNMYVLLCPQDLMKSHSNDSFKPSNGGGIKDLNKKELNSDEQSSLFSDVRVQGKVGADFNSTLESADKSNAQNGFLPDENSVVRWAAAFHQRYLHDSEKNIGILKSHEIEQIAQNWLVKLRTNGGTIDGMPLRKPRAALESFINSYADNHSKRCNEFHERKFRKKTRKQNFDPNENMEAQWTQRIHNKKIIMS